MSLSASCGPERTPSLPERIHGCVVLGRRVRVLCAHLAEVVPANATMLDVGCGDGLLAAELKRRRPDLSIEGVDVLARPGAAIPVRTYDGRQLPFADRSVDAVLLADTLHHAADPQRVLREASRVASRCLVIKDHLRTGWLAGPTLAVMDWVGNRRFGVALPGRYWTEEEWRASFAALGARIGHWNTRLGLYPWPASLVFDRSLHFLARLDLERSD